MVISCCAFSCIESHKKENNISFYHLPNDPSMREKWLIAIKRPNLKPTIGLRVCSKHFKKDDFFLNQFTNEMQLSKDAVPSVFDFPHLNIDEKSVIEDPKDLNSNSTAFEVSNDVNSTSVSKLPIKNICEMYSNFCEEDLKDTRKVDQMWVLTKRIVEEQQNTIKRLRNKCYLRIKRIKRLEKRMSRITNINGLLDK